MFCAPRYIQKPAFECEVLRDRNTFGKSHFPYEGEHRKGEPPVVYDINDTPGTAEGLATVVVLPWNEKYTKRARRATSPKPSRASRRAREEGVMKHNEHQARPDSRSSA